MKFRKIIVSFVVGWVIGFSSFNTANAINLPDLVITQITIDRIEWRRMPDCDHNACQNLIWKALIEFSLTVENQGTASAQIPNGNFESSGILDVLTHKEDNRFIAQVQNWETVPNPVLPGQRVRLNGRMYIQEDTLKLQDEYLLCLTITDRPSDNQNWNLLESNTKNNTFCRNFILNLPTHTNPNPRVNQVNAPFFVLRNDDGSVDFQVTYIVQNSTRQVYAQDIGRHVTVIDQNGIEINYCNGNISPGLHGGETQNVVCQIHLPGGTVPGFYKLKVIVDERNRILESNEFDNLLTRGIQII